MPPTSILTYRDRARSRLRENVRQAALAGAPLPALEVLLAAAKSGNITYDEANRQVREMRQDAREYKAVARDARRAYIAATSDERMTLDQLAIACKARAMTPAEAHQLVATIRDCQRDRIRSAA